MNGMNELASFNQIGAQMPPLGYGFHIKYTTFTGGGGSFGVNGCGTPEEAREKALSWALKSGWENPKWWQWWRWDDTKVQGLEL